MLQGDWPCEGSMAPCQTAEGLLREEALGRFGRVGQAGEESTAGSKTSKGKVQT